MRTLRAGVLLMLLTGCATTAPARVDRVPAGEQAGEDKSLDKAAR